MTRGPLLVIDTSTARAVVAIGDPAGALIAEDTWAAGHRHGEELLDRVARLLEGNGVALRDVAGIVVGTGPGAFTGLRVGMATAKGLAHALDRPIVGVSSGEALLTASGMASAVLLLPAGPSDRVVVRHGDAPHLLPGGIELEVRAGETTVAVDLEGRAPDDARERGERARAGIGAALLALGATRLASGEPDDLGQLVPEYVTLPRGVRASTGEVAWSRDPR